VAASVLSPLTDGRVWSDRVEVYLEWYPVAGRTPTSARFEVTERVDAQPLTSAGAVVAGADDGRRWTARGGVDLTMVPPGAYLLLGRVFEGTRLVGTSVRPFRFEGALFSAGGPRLPFSLASAGALVSQFRREQVLRPDAVGFFLGRLAATESGALPPALAQASEAARAGQFEAVLSQVGDVSDPPLTAAFLRGLALYAAGDLETAGDQFRAALRASNDFLPAAFYLGACYAAGGRDREAVGAWQTSLVSESDARIVYDVLADGWLRLREGARAEAILREAMERWPDDASFVPRLAAAMAAQGRRNEALDALRPYLDGHPRDTDALFLGVRLLYDAYSAGKAVKTGPEDAAQAAAWAARYREAQGPNQALVDRWAVFVRQKGEGRK
jgi:tetratricopeptide (TPR) repeat protein